MADITLADLWTKCSKCGGGGRYTPPVPPQPPHELVTHNVSETERPECYGVGGYATDSGRAVLTFLRNEAGNCCFSTA